MAIDKETIRGLEAQLEAEKEKLEGELKELEKPVDFGSDVDHFEEEADEAEEFANQSAQKLLFRERLEQIKEALQRISNGGYGVCSKCGKEIELEVLEASPESSLCKNCKSEQ